MPVAPATQDFTWQLSLRHRSRRPLGAGRQARSLSLSPAMAIDLQQPNLTLCVRRPSAAAKSPAIVVGRSSLPSTLPTNHIVIKVETFGFSANNVTYQALGEQPHFRYFDFHPVPADIAGSVAAPKTHGLVPVWGFGTVVASAHAKIPVGERVYGYFAPARYLVVPVSPNDVNKHAFYVPRPHLPEDRRPYNQIIRCATDPQYSSSPLDEALTMLYRPLFWTAFWFEDWMHTLNYRGASAFLISSASAKTAFCAAYVIRKRRAREGADVRIVGLTSARNLAFTQGLGLYDAVFTYEQLAHVVPRERRWVYVDVAGNDALNTRLFAEFAAEGRREKGICELVTSVALGMTNLAPASEQAGAFDWGANTAKAPRDGTSGTRMEQFFMPEWLSVRKNQLSLEEIFERQHRAWADLMVDGKNWVKIVHVSGAERVKSAYERVAEDGFSPDIGFIWSMWDSKDAKL
ncbi:unnamed protein product [Mycena citricolor]|uniref:DUF2855 family protein n=1 Tax=Mycena citricolor TaxID=2018698 RepID=A0AAD2HX07_9AGAR|nr:unnamed protein product [Mycena citricolor]